MSDETSAPAGGEAIAVITPAADAPESFSAHAAAQMLSDIRAKKSESAAPAEAVETPNELAEEANAAPATDPGEEPEAIDPVEKPPIEPPRSWTKEAKERWSALPPETQEYLAQREQERDREVRKLQNETADKLKGLTAKEQAVEQARQAYEARLPAIEQALLDVQSRDFPDIKSMSDVEKLATEDPFRYLQWQAHQQKLQAVNYERTQAEQRQYSERATKWNEHIQAENAKVAELHPETADPKIKAQLQEKAVALLEDKGFTQSELNELASGKEKLSIFDHRIQSLLLDGVKYRDAKAAPQIAVTKTVPPVQRPGIAPPRGAAQSEALKALESQLNNSGSLKAAQALRAAQVRAQQRRAS